MGLYEAQYSAFADSYPAGYITPMHISPVCERVMRGNRSSANVLANIGFSAISRFFDKMDTGQLIDWLSKERTSE